MLEPSTQTRHKLVFSNFRIHFQNEVKFFVLSYFFRIVDTLLKSRNLQKGTSRTLLDVMPNLTPLLQTHVWRGNMKGQKELIFGYVIQLLILYCLAHKRTIFVILCLSALSPTKNIIEFRPEIILTRVYLIHIQFKHGGRA